MIIALKAVLWSGKISMAISLSWYLKELSHVTFNIFLLYHFGRLKNFEYIKYIVEFCDQMVWFWCFCLIHVY